MKVHANKHDDMDCKLYFYLVDYKGVENLYANFKHARKNGKLNNATDVERESKFIKFFMREVLEIKKDSEKILNIQKRVNVTKENPYYFLIMMAPCESNKVETYDILAGPKPSH